MGFDLLSDNGSALYWSNVSWSKLLVLARLGGWQPAGTEPPPGWDDVVDRLGEWRGGYSTNDEQRVTPEDALALADALECVLDDIPDGTVPDQVVEYDEQTRVDAGAPPAMNLIKALTSSGFRVAGPNARTDPFSFFGGEYKQKVVEFIRFCRQGGFIIW